MADSPLGSPVVVDGILSDEKLGELLALQTEYPELDYKSTIDLGTKRDRVELAKDVAAMQVRGGYILLGVDNHGSPTGGLDGADTRAFDEASLTPILLKWLPDPLDLRARVAKREDHVVVLVYVGRHRRGCAVFRADGAYDSDRDEVVVFRQGDIYWRDGTRSVRITQAGLEEIVERRIADAKSDWLEEQQDIRRRERLDLEIAYEARRLAEGPLGTVSFDLAPDALAVAALELLREDDTIALLHLLKEAVIRARLLIDRDEIENELGQVVDKLSCIGATFLEYDRDDWLQRVIDSLCEIYSLPLRPGDAQRYGFSTAIDPTATAPRVWLVVIERVYALGALAVRRKRWTAVRELTVQRPDRLSAYDANWLRHAVTMTSRAEHLQAPGAKGGTIEISMLSLARNVIAGTPCLSPDGLSSDDDAVLTSLAQFDVLSNLVAIDDAKSAGQKVFYTNFARFSEARVLPVVEQLLTDPPMRTVLFRGDDDALARALAEVGTRAATEGMRFAGFDGWEHSSIQEFISEHLRPDSD